MSNNFKYNIKPYCIYFPQFHNILENDINFYENYTDVHNLELLYNSSNLFKSNIETPNKNVFKINNLSDYNLVNKNIIQTQIDILEEYNLAGFAMYYYWFSKNTITNQHMILKDPINIFFSDDIYCKNSHIFFIWANENWSNNPAFGKSTHKIENTYEILDIRNNINNLILYFKNEKYLKINNKPVFFIHHPWFITDDELNNIYLIFDEECKKNKFNGIYIILNNLCNKNYGSYKTYYNSPNYKKSNSIKYNSIDNKNYLHYDEYINEKNDNDTNNIKSLFFDFNNCARLYKPDNISKATICINNTEINKINFVTKILDKYKNSNDEIYKILLINAWNEWGEKMHIEPSNEYMWYYLNFLTKYISN
jgi:hypothetical protein